MARDWNDIESVREDLFKRMDAYGVNIAPVPYAVCFERGVGWTVDVHVKVRGVTEFEVCGEGKTYPDAMRRAYLALNNEPMVLVRAATSNAAFGVAV